MMDAPALIHILTDAGSPEFQKAKACQRVGEFGGKRSRTCPSSLNITPNF